MGYVKVSNAQKMREPLAEQKLEMHVALFVRHAASIWSAWLLSCVGPPTALQNRNSAEVW